jgi:ubiquinone/menaquinone biosynthesis C-methylase UbiE
LAEREQWQVAADAAALYEQHLVPAFFGPWATDLVQLARLEPGVRVLDIACGTGVVARAAERAMGSAELICGLDLNPGMIAMAHQATSTEGTRVARLRGSALTLPFSDGAFDVAFCQQGLQFFPDRPMALREMHRILRAQGLVVLSVWRSIEYRPELRALSEAMDRHIGPGASATNRSSTTLGNPEELGRLVTNAGFRDVVVQSARRFVRYDSVEEFLRIRALTTPPGDPLKRVDDATHHAIFEDVSFALQEYVSHDGLIFPMDTHLLTARSSP